ncbi:MAG: hypothetical protein PF590_05885 [Candidatus Delongbacteria bacterium]|jgi:hypothetical protein|nr:hypothetical protein [Candidatus Delongbacteria bacterium]
MLVLKIISTLIILIATTWMVYKLPLFRRTGLKTIWRLSLWGAKIVASLAVLAIYTWHYPQETADIYKYYNDGKAIVENADTPNTYIRIITGVGIDTPEVKQCLEHTGVWYRGYFHGVWNDNRIMIRYNALLYPVTGGSIVAHSFLMAFLSFLGLTLLYLGITYFTKGRFWLALAVYMVPSVFFWSSGLLKEGILMLNTGLLFYTISLLHKGFKLKILLLIILAVGLFIMTKIYVLICMIPGLVFLLATKQNKHIFRNFIITHIVIILLVWISGCLYPKLNMFRLLDKKQHHFVSMVQARENVGSAINLPELKPNILSVLRHSPTGFFNSMFRPHFLEWNSPLMLVAGIEKLILLIMLVYACIWPRNVSKKEIKFLLFSLSFILILFVTTGLSTPVLGALVRYNIPAMPFFVAGIIMLGNWKKIRIKRI